MCIYLLSHSGKEWRRASSSLPVLKCTAILYFNATSPDVESLQNRKKISLRVTTIAKVYSSVLNSATKLKIQWRSCMERLGQGLPLPFLFCLNFLNLYGQN